jgi:hypothetical protein
LCQAPIILGQALAAASASTFADRTSLEKFQVAQILAWFVEAATAECGHKPPPVSDPLEVNLPIAPGKEFVIEFE